MAMSNKSLYHINNEGSQGMIYSGLEMSKMFDIVETIELLMNKPEYLGIYECTSNQLWKWNRPEWYCIEHF